MKIQVTCDDVSLFHLAVRYLGDALQWWRIAACNGMSDPDLSGFEVPVQILLPDKASVGQTGGLPEV